METISKINLRQLWIVAAIASLFIVPPSFAQSGNKSAVRKRATGVADSAALDEKVRKADAARTAGNSGEALRLYEDVLRSRPNWAEGWWYVGTIHYDSDAFTKAIPAFERLLKLEPKYGPGWAFLGLCEFGVKKYPVALEHLQRASEFGFGDAATARVGNYHRALLLNAAGRFEEATSVLWTQFAQEKISPQVAVVMGLALLEMPILPADLDVTKKELVFSAGQASAELSHQRYAEALAILKAIERDHPDVPNVHYSSAKALIATSQWDEAADQLQSELQINPKSAEAHALLATVRLKEGKTAEALASAKQAEAIEPKGAEVHRMLATFYSENGNKERAEQELAKAKSLGWAEPTSASDVKSDATSTSTSAEGNAAFEQLKQKAYAAEHAGDSAGAVAAYREGLQLNPNWVEGLFYLATAEYGAQQYEDALAKARRLSTVQPNVGAAWALLGLCEFQVGDYENSYVYLKRGEDLGLPPGGGGAISEAYYHMGILLNWKGDFGGAHDVLAREAKGGPRAEDSKFALGINLLRLRLLPSQVAAADRPLVQAASEIAMDLSGSEYGPATAKFDELLKKYPGRPYIHDAYAWTLMSISKYDAAVEQYREEIRLSPKSADAYLGVATAALKIHKYEDARDAAKKAIELAPESAMAHGQYGRALVELGDVNTGTVELERAVQLAVAIPELHFSLSRAYAKAKRPKDAERERQIFLRLSKKE